MGRKYKYKIELVAFHITTVCSHRCPFCYATDNQTKAKHAPISKIKRIIDALAESKVQEITLLGGDPASHPNVIETAKYISDYEIKPSILSNTLSFHGKIEEAAKYFHTLETTIHHYIPEQHDKVCKKKYAYKNIIKNLRKLSDMNCKIGIAINITPLISDKIYKLARHIKYNEGIKLDYIIIQRLIPMGRAASSSEIALTKSDVDVSMREISRIDKELGIKITVEDPFPLCILSQKYRKYMTPCQWGYTKASVNFEGGLSRCGADPRYQLGNILETTLLEIWNTSPILKQFRSKKYVTGRCSICSDLEKCGGGCPLSCQIEGDHGVDYLYLDAEKIDAEVHGKIEFGNAEEDELSSILLLEWSNFTGYGHIFSVESLRKWYKHNPKMFYVIRDSRKWVLGYGTLVPVTKKLFSSITSGQLSSLTEFPKSEVLKHQNSDYYHVEVLATVPTRTSPRTGSYLIRFLGEEMLKYAKYVSASPITKIGIKLCKYFNFKHVTDQSFENKVYPIYTIKINKSKFKQLLSKF